MEVMLRKNLAQNIAKINTTMHHHNIQGLRHSEEMNIPLHGVEEGARTKT